MVWRMLLREMVGRAAREALSEQLARSAGQQAGGEASPADDPPDDRAAIGLVFALGIEAGGTEDLLGNPQHTRGEGLRMVRGILSGRRVVLMQCGAGRKSAAAGTAALIAGDRPEWVISAGLAGGLRDQLARGDFVFANAIIGSDGSRCALGGLAGELAASLDLQGSRGHVGTLLTVDRPIREPAEKRALADRHGASAVDMESLAVAEVCAEQHTRLVAVRIISDAVGDALPPEVEKLLAQKSAARRAGAALGAILNRPGSFSEMLRLKEQALLASDRLGRVVAQVVARLP